MPFRPSRRQLLSGIASLSALAGGDIRNAFGQAPKRVIVPEGDFAPLLSWLRANVHRKGSLADTDTILSQATGAPVGTAAFKAHLETRYLSA